MANEVLILCVFNSDSLLHNRENWPFTSFAFLSLALEFGKSAGVRVFTSKSFIFLIPLEKLTYPDSALKELPTLQ